MKRLQSRLPLAQPFGTRPTLRNRLRSSSCSCAPLATATALPSRCATVQSFEARTFQKCFQCKANWRAGVPYPLQHAIDVTTDVAVTESCLRKISHIAILENKLGRG